MHKCLAVTLARRGMLMIVAQGEIIKKLLAHSEPPEMDWEFAKRACMDFVALAIPLVEEADRFEKMTGHSIDAFHQEAN